jgi:transposase InsO family protein
LNDPIPRPRRAWGKHRFERPHSNGLWRADFKLTEQDESMITFLDDHSHFVPDSRVHHNPTEEHAIKLLEESMRRYRKPKPEQILIDRGSHFNPA